MEDADQRATPLIRLARFAPEQTLYAKAELLHPSGSAYDRIARPILEDLGDGPAIVAGAGSVSLAFCRAAALLGRELLVVCPESTLPEHLHLLAQHSARLIRTPAAEGLVGAHERAETLARESGGRIAFSVGVFEQAHRIFAETLGEEIVHAFEALPEQPEVVVAPVAAGALLGGIGRALEQGGFSASLIGSVRPAQDSLQDGTVARNEITDRGIGIEEVPDEEAFETRMKLAKSEGLLVGMGSAAAVRVAEAQGRPAIAIVVDAGDRYFSVDRRLSK